MTSLYDDNVLMAFADGQVDAATARQVEAAIATNAALRRRAELFRNTARLMRAAFPVEHAVTGIGPAASNGVEIGAASAPRGAAAARPWYSSGNWSSRPAARIAAVLMVAVAAASAGYTAGSGQADRESGAHVVEDRVNEVAQYYRVYAEDDRFLVERGPGSSGELAAWVSARLRRQVPVPDLSAHQFALRGGRMFAIEKATAANAGAGSQPAILIAYDGADGAVIGLNVTASISNKNLAPSRAANGGYNVVHWVDGGLLYVLAGPVDPARLEHVVSAIRQTAAAH